MLQQMTLWDTSSATSLQELADGVLPCAPPAGRMTDQCGPAHAPASRLVLLASAAALTTSGTSGPCGVTSLRSAALQLSLENKLREAVDLNGSPEFGMIWKHKAMPLGPPIFRLAASQRHKNANASGLLPWATPKASDGEKASALSKGAPSSRPATRLPTWTGAAVAGADGKRRRAEPGVFALGHGIPNRVEQLRGYGNAIVPGVAALFVACHMRANVGGKRETTA